MLRLDGFEVPDELRHLFTTERSLEVYRRLLASAVDAWLELGGVGPAIDWTDDNRAQIHLGGDSLFGALALQLALAISRRDGLAICDECSSAFIPNRRRPIGGPCYCARRECRVLTPKRRWAAKNRDARKSAQRSAE